ncbi:hypothetical protein ACEQ8H_002690 [Pleosporales sp. CAS-2024a]
MHQVSGEKGETEGGDYAPIQQSYELRKLRAENLRLKERLRASRIPIEDEDSDFAASPDSHLGERSGSSQRRRAAKQRRYQGSEWQDSIYFGSPGLASVVTDFATVNISPMSATMSYLMPRGQDMYTPKSPPPYPFPSFFPATPDECIPELLKCLPQREELFECLHAFEKRVHVCSFPHVPFEITKSEVERFLNDARRNSEICPDMLALLFAAIALGGQHSVWDRSGGQWGSDAMQFEEAKGNIYIAAAKQALRLASFMHKPSLLGIQALLMIGPYLTNSGRFLDAWTLFGTTIRLAHSIGLHRHPKHLDPAPPTQRECSIRQTLWWWMLHTDEQYSMTLGRPLGISGLGDCPPPHELTTDPQMLRFSEFINYFTILARQILSSERLTNAKVDEFTDSLKGLLDTMPEMLQFDKSWLAPETDIPEWPLSAMAAVYHCKAHTYLILLNRQRLDKFNAQSQHALNHTKAPMLTFRPVNRTPSSQASPTTASHLSLRGRGLVLASAADVLDGFIFFHIRVPAALVSWTMGQQAFNACMILLLDAIERASVTRGAMQAERALVVFKDLQKVHSLATLAVERISWGVQKLHDVTRMATGGGAELPGCFASDNNMARAWNEAMHLHVPHVMRKENAMGATGMFLLEDSGLQGFVPEAFTPIAWNLGGGGMEPPMPFPLKRERRSSQGGDAMAFSNSEDDMDDGRSVEAMQGGRRWTTRSVVPTRYATPALDDPPPPPNSGTASALRMDSASSMQHHHYDVQTALLANSYHQGQLPHSQHARLYDHDQQGDECSVYPMVASVVMGKRKPQYEGDFLGVHEAAPTAQMRHKSCPSLHEAASAAPLEARPTYSSPTAKMRSTPGGHAAISDQASFQEFVENHIPQHSSSSNSSPRAAEPGWAPLQATTYTDRCAKCQTQGPTTINDDVLSFHTSPSSMSEFPQTMVHHQQPPASAYAAAMHVPVSTHMSNNNALSSGNPAGGEWGGHWVETTLPG